MLPTHRMTECKCPKCGKTLDAASSIEYATPPDPGDISVCIDCLTILRFTKDLSLLELTEAEISRLDPKTLAEVAEIRRMIAWVKEKTK